MRATFLYGHEDVRIDDVPDPGIQQPTDAIVHVVRAAVCGSDLHHYRRDGTLEHPRPMGHEFIGVVEDVGADVRTVRRGDLVVATFSYQDNTCVYCREGNQTSCIHGGWYGAGGVGGGQAEAVRVPQADGSLVTVPGPVDEALYPHLLALCDVYLTGLHGVRSGRVDDTSTVAVIGDGAVGLSAVHAASHRGARKVILVSHHTDRAARGRDLGATEIVAERDEGATDHVHEVTDGEGVRVVVEAVGHLDAYEQAYRMVRPGGIISRVGVPQYTDAPVGPTSLFNRNITLTGGVAPVRAYLDEAIGDVLNGTITPGSLLDTTLPLGRVADAYAAMAGRTALKVMLVP